MGRRTSRLVDKNGVEPGLSVHGAAFTDARLRRWPACGPGPICPGLGAPQGWPLAARAVRLAGPGRLDRSSPPGALLAPSGGLFSGRGGRRSRGNPAGVPLARAVFCTDFGGVGLFLIFLLLFIRGYSPALARVCGPLFSLFSGELSLFSGELSLFSGELSLFSGAVHKPLP